MTLHVICPVISNDKEKVPDDFVALPVPFPSSGARNLVKTTATAFDTGTQFPEDAGESLRPQFLRVLTVAWRAPIKRNCIQDELSRLQKVIQDTREEVWNAEQLLQHRDRLHPKARASGTWGLRVASLLWWSATS
eukprot:2671559-Rhodomonas_salina.1